MKCFPLFLAVLIFTCPVAFAGPLFSVSIDDPILDVGPEEEIFIYATLTNESASAQVFSGAPNTTLSFDSGSLIKSLPGLPDPYVATSSLPSGAAFSTQFQNLVLEPDEQFNFLFLTLTPEPTPASPGIYLGQGFVFHHNGVRYEFPNLTEYPVADFVVTIIPEPTTITLAAFSLLAIFYRQRSPHSPHTPHTNRRCCSSEVEV